MAGSVESRTAVIVAVISSIGGGIAGNLLPTLINYDSAKTSEELKQAKSELARMRDTHGALSRDLERQRAGRQSCAEAIDEYLASKEP
jgi:hypothetical protein